MRKLLRKVSLEMVAHEDMQKYLWMLCSTRCALSVRVGVAVGTVCRGRCDGCSFEVQQSYIFSNSAKTCAANHVSQAQAARYNAVGATLAFFGWVCHLVIKATFARELVEITLTSAVY
jgi:hypothetical protein